MGIVDDKKKVFGQIGALRTLTEGFPDVTLTNSFPSLNNDASSLDFLIDLLKSLIGFEEMKGSVVDILTYQLRDIELEVVYFYCVGPGYLLQLFAFGLIFPHAVFYYQTIMKFEIEKHSPVKVIEKYIEHVQEPLDLDKFIAEEELKQKFEIINSNEEVDQVYDEFIKSRC